MRNEMERSSALIIDTHAHLNFAAYREDGEQVIKRALDKGIGMINVGSQKDTSFRAVELAQKYPSGVFAAVGLHPVHLSKGKVEIGVDSDESLEVKTRGEKFDYNYYRQLAESSEKVVAIGETGLDFYRIPEGEDEEKIKELQKKIFERHLDLAEELKKPVIIHCRKAHDEMLGILEKRRGGIKGVAHSFLGNLRQARHYRELGFKLGFNGIITYARDYDKVLLDTPLGDILIETDCPYLTPAPYRGQRNEPLYVIEVARKLAEIKKVSYEEIIDKTALNARNLFGA